MAGPGADELQYVLTRDAVRASIEALQAQRIHRFFPAYLHLRRQSTLQDAAEAIAPDWNSLGDLVAVPGGPVGRPYYMPFWDQQRSAGQEWRAKNLAGSYAPSSIRQVPRKVVDVDSEGRYILRERHWELARKHLMYGKPILVLALAGFLLRNFALIGNEHPATDDLAAAFYDRFGYEPNSEEASHLFDPDQAGADSDWFESFEPSDHELS